MPVGLKNLPLGPYQGDTASGAEFLYGDHFVFYPGGIVIDAAARHAGKNPNTTLRKGLAMGKITASGKYTGFDPDGSDGTEIARGILNKDVDLLDPNGNAKDAHDAPMVIHGFYYNDRVTDEDGAALSVEAKRNLFGIDGSAGTEAITGCQLSPIV